MSRLLALIALVLSVGCGSAGRPAGNVQCAWRVCVRHDDTRSGRSYTARNSEPVPVTVSLGFHTLENLVPVGMDQVEVVIPPRASAVLMRLRKVRPDGPVGAAARIQIDLGSSTNQADDFVYAVPFGGDEPRELVQGFNGSETHLGSMRYSLDFAMPEGTPILAAREGQVLLVQDGFTEGGVDPALLERANLVVVAHSDGSMASYGHLHRGVRVRVGQRVREGQLLGYSGHTGFAGQPHLHFHVGNRMLGEPGRTIPIEMRDGGGNRVDLTVGTLVEPAHPMMRTPSER
ncbi:MAG: M23 family metallopeptidase [Gemmatimonadota bacterium]